MGPISPKPAIPGTRTTYRTFRCIESEAQPNYLAAIVRTEWFWSRLAHATRGVGARRERTRPEQFLNIEIPMPDLNRQRMGERVIPDVDALKRVQAETGAELDALLPSILDRAFKGELQTTMRLFRRPLCCTTTPAEDGT